jgi:dynamin 1-like protein
MLPKSTKVKSKFEEEEKIGDDKSKGGILGLLGFKKGEKESSLQKSQIIEEEDEDMIQDSYK